MKVEYKSYDEFIEACKVYFGDECEQCNGICELAEDNILCTIEKRSFDFISLIVLRCKKCGTTFLPTYSKRTINYIYKTAVDNNKMSGRISSSGYKKKFNYCIDNDFDYDYRDFYNIPGLCYNENSFEDGFLTPVYFEKEALVYFFNVPDYEVEIFSESYGKFAKKDPSGLDLYEWNIQFGFNTNGRLVIWLGDIDKMDMKTREILKPFNISSDHLLTDSDFYRAQIKCTFSEPIIEKQILINKKAFISNINKKYSIDLSHLTDECLQHERNVKRPVVYSETTVGEVINAYDKILIEGFNIVKLKELYEEIYSPDERDKKYTNWKSIKLIEAILNKLSILINNMDIALVISPLYILHDYRNILNHLLPADEIFEKKSHIANTLGVKSFDDQKTIYDKEIKGLNELFNYLAILSK